MSKFSNKSDLYDVITIHKSFKEFKKRFPNIYIGHSTEPIKYTRINDLVPYYPFIPWFVYSNKNGGGMIKLDDKSYIDTLDEENILPKESIRRLRNLLADEIERAKRNDYLGTVQFNG